MKILAFSDIHENYEYAEMLMQKAKDVDMILCAGDITVFGEDLGEAINFLDSFGKKVFCVHGNHESEIKMKKLCEKTKNVVFIHENHFFFKDVLIVGYGGGGFSKYDEGFEKISKSFGELVKNSRKSILLTHAPPNDTKVDVLYDDYHVGNKSIRKFIDLYFPSLVVSGHVHESFKKIDKIGKSVLINPGPEGAIIEM